MHGFGIVILLIFFVLILFMSSFLVGRNGEESIFLFIFLFLSTVIILISLELLLFYALVKQENEILPPIIKELIG